MSSHMIAGPRAYLKEAVMMKFVASNISMYSRLPNLLRIYPRRPGIYRHGTNEGSRSSFHYRRSLPDNSQLLMPQLMTCISKVPALEPTIPHLERALKTASATLYEILEHLHLASESDLNYVLRSISSIGLGMSSILRKSTDKDH